MYVHASESAHISMRWPCWRDGVMVFGVMCLDTTTRDILDTQARARAHIRLRVQAIRVCHVRVLC